MTDESIFVVTSEKMEYNPADKKIFIFFCRGFI